MMIEPAESEIDVEVLKARIRDAVAARESNGQASFIATSRELYHLLSANDAPSNSSLAELLVADISERQQDEPRLGLQPTFQPHADGRYRLEELLQFHDHAFIWNAYRAILKREPDEVGYQGYLARLRSGERNKIDILASLRFSPEGRRANVEIEGLKTRAWFRRIYLIPVLGYLAELLVSLARLPMLLRYQRRLENHLIAQQDIIANYLDERLATHKSYYRDYTNQVAARFAESLSNLNKQHEKIARVMQRQLAALFREHQKINTYSPNGSAQRVQLSDRRWQEFYAAFETQFRGAPENVKNDLQPHLSLLKETGISANVIDLGSGRGEWLELLNDNGIEATGVEANPVFAAQLRSKGFSVVAADVLEHISGLSNESVQAVTAFHLIEHFSFAQLIPLFDQIKRILRPGGLLILETPNPKNLVVGACNFYADPTHGRPLFPETLEFMLNHLGFSRVRIEYLHPVEGSPFQNDQPGAKELNTWLFGARDYAAIGWKN